MNQFLKIVNFLTILFFIEACTTNKPVDDKIEEDADQNLASVCIWDKIGTREKALKNSKIVSRLNLGEVIIHTGKKAVDSSFHNQVYLQVIIDNQKLWVPQMAIITKAKAGVIKEEAQVYLRPDLLTISNKTVPVMEIVAISQEQEEWVYFTSEKKQTEGWIKSENVSFEKDDIGFALYTKRTINEKPDEPFLEKIDFIIQNNPYTSSSFLEVLKTIRQKEAEKKAIEEMMVTD